MVYECKCRYYFDMFQILRVIIHEVVGLMYELHTAVWTLRVLGQNVIGLIAQETTAMGADIISLKLMIEFLSYLGNLGGIPICLYKEYNRGNDG